MFWLHFGSSLRVVFILDDTILYILNLIMYIPHTRHSSLLIRYIHIVPHMYYFVTDYT